MEEKYNVIFTGRLHSGISREKILRNLSADWKMEPAKVQRILTAGKPLIIKKGLNRELAEKFRHHLEKIGLRIQLNRTSAVAPPSVRPSSAPPANKVKPAAHVPAGIQGDSRSHQPAATTAVNPYASPKANLKIEKKTTDKWLGAPQKVPAVHGWRWITAATSMFLAQPWKWIGMSVVAGLLVLLINMIPFAGVIASSILAALLGGGLALAAEGQRSTGLLKFGDMFKGFTSNRNRLILVGTIHIAALALVGLIMALIAGKEFWAFFGFGEIDPQTAVETMENKMPLLITVWIVVIFLSIPWTISTWFATILVAVSDQKPLTAFKLSFKGFIKNILAFLVLGLTFVVIGIALIIAFSLFTGLLTFFVGNQSFIFFALIPLFIMILIGFPLMTVSGLCVYQGCKDIYYKATKAVSL